MRKQKNKFAFVVKEDPGLGLSLTTYWLTSAILPNGVEEKSVKMSDLEFPMCRGKKILTAMIGYFFTISYEGCPLRQKFFSSFLRKFLSGMGTLSRKSPQW